MFANRPFLIIPKLIEQPTWGGDYILNLKHWSQHAFLKNKKIGQSYELFGGAKLLLTITDSQDPSFVPELGSADTPAIAEKFFPYYEGKDYITMESLMATQTGSTMPLLIKINQAYGNSFQLHIKPSLHSDRWQPKPESWYYLEDGKITFGIKEGIDINEYRKTCHHINETMKQYSNDILTGALSREEGNKKAQKLIQDMNPWQYVNVCDMKKYSLLDLSMGGLHHSWEEDKQHYPHGNIVYEVQRDVMDPVSTIRSFDQGKIKSDGSIREIHIDDYFKYLDTDPTHNDLKTALKQRQGNKMLATPYYSMDIIELNGSQTEKTGHSFCHLFVRDGDVMVQTEGGSVHITQGHSCFIPASIETYTIISQNGSSTLLKSYI